MRVRTLIEFRDLETDLIRKIGDEFETSSDRVEELNSTRYGIMVEVVENILKESGDKNAGKSKVSTKNKKRNV